ncbi:hypothetical protein PAE1020 [Pyrobaculum aerophilum str. IM2]|uniref:Uncharacterized protein n=1 Tax=Pyrobaculum aerophilum (strain ATCC 51768 / DSM 7523 / JCM 9630 / CIP 104966 / NBRC 100827 / IM2) TaxID=178306 RepID=Q8ZXZ2_PYRAE|nr:hypothetical protein PAE1020 [Pyrobaculum aerophilum str. IM2]
MRNLFPRRETRHCLHAQSHSVSYSLVSVNARRESALGTGGLNGGERLNGHYALLRKARPEVKEGAVLKAPTGEDVK